ncbi:MAG: maleylpyruvate isomerase family mycothiol-dependent enzyme [Sporichthyaceae bacterium]|nr:maleylpyruvate isomerase family mycothiol-dependent enzyme [Sporichthyaceae bacterium]
MTSYRDPTSSLAEVDGATARVIATARQLTDADLAEPSPLPLWTRGHVLTHIARNADALRNLLIWAATGVETPMYASPEARHDDINAGAVRPAAEQAADVVDSAARFAEAAQQVPEANWSNQVQMRGGLMIPAWEIFVRRLNEVEIHHVDLDAGYTPAHWPPGWVSRALSDITDGLATREDYPHLVLHCEDTDRDIEVRPTGSDATITISGPEPALMAWLIGRSTGDGLTVEPHDTPLPALPKWS